MAGKQITIIDYKVRVTEKFVAINKFTFYAKEYKDKEGGFLYFFYTKSNETYTFTFSTQNNRSVHVHRSVCQ